MTEPTLQQAAPLESANPLRLFATACGALAVVAALVLTVLEQREVANWGFEGAGIAVLGLAALTAAGAASPARAPFRMRSHVLVLGLVLVAFVLDELGQLRANVVIHDDWGLIAVPLFLWLLAVVRPAVEVLIGGLVATLVVAGTAMAVSPYLLQPVGPTTRATIAIASVLPMALAAPVLVTATLRALRRTPPVATPRGDDDAVRLSVQQEQIAQLEAEVVPLLRQVLAAGALREADGVRARDLATGLRTALVAELARDWLSEAGFAVTDPDGYAERLTAEQRTAVRAALAALPVAAPEAPGTAALRGQDRDGVLEIVVTVDGRPQRADWLPAVGRLRSVFAHVRLRRDPDAVTVALEFHIP